MRQDVAKPLVESARSIAVILPPVESEPWIPIADQRVPVMDPQARVMPAAHQRAKCQDQTHVPGPLGR